MSAKKIIYSDEARTKLKKGVDALAKAVAPSVATVTSPKRPNFLVLDVFFFCMMMLLYLFIVQSILVKDFKLFYCL